MFPDDAGERRAHARHRPEQILLADQRPQPRGDADLGLGQRHQIHSRGFARRQHLTAHTAEGLEFVKRRREVLAGQGDQLAGAFEELGLGEVDVAVVSGLVQRILEPRHQPRRRVGGQADGARDAVSRLEADA